MRIAYPSVTLAAVMLIALTTSAAAQGGDICAAIAELDRAAADDFASLRETFEGRTIPPSGGPVSLFTGRALFEGGIDARVAVPDGRPATYSVRLSGGSDVAFRRLASRIDACRLHAFVAEPTRCSRDRGCARTYRFRSGAIFYLRYAPAVIDLMFAARAPTPLPTRR
jgi:hypothetical protein